MHHEKQPRQHEAEQTKKKPESHVKKRKLRLDRVAVVVVPLLLIVLLIGALCLHSYQKNGGFQTEDSNSSEVSLATASTSTNHTEASTDHTDSTNTAADAASSTGAAETTESNGSVNSADGTEITLKAADVEKGNLILINQDHVYTFPEGDPELEGVHKNSNGTYSVSDMEVQLDAETISQLNAMMEAFQEETGNSNLQVFSGYRTEEDQQQRYESGSSGFQGGYSDYHSGRTFNIKIEFGDGTSDYYNATKYPDYSWISEHAAEYGFVVRFPSDKESSTGEDGRSYTFRYVGVPHAVYMQEHDLCLEEYLELVQSCTAENPLEIETADGTYAVYYVAAESTGTTKATALSDNYTVSGDNCDGFVITCQMEADSSASTTEAVTAETEAATEEE